MAHEEEKEISYHDASTFNNASAFQTDLILRIHEGRVSGSGKQLVYTNVKKSWVMETVEALLGKDLNVCTFSFPLFLYHSNSWLPSSTSQVTIINNIDLSLQQALQPFY